MQTKKKDYLFALIMLFLTGYVLGQIEVKAAGKFLIPTAGGVKEYEGVITFTKAGVEIECQKKIFQPFNEFDTPKQRKLSIAPADLKEIWFDKKNNIGLFPSESFYNRYRNMFFRYARKYSLMYEPYIEYVLVFVLNDPGAIDNEDKKLILFLNKVIRGEIKKEENTCGPKRKILYLFYSCFLWLGML